MALHIKISTTANVSTSKWMASMGDGYTSIAEPITIDGKTSLGPKQFSIKTADLPAFAAFIQNAVEAWNKAKALEKVANEQ